MGRGRPTCIYGTLKSPPWYAQVLADLEGQQAAAQGQENSFWGVGGMFGKARPAAAQLAAAASQFGIVKN